MTKKEKQELENTQLNNVKGGEKYFDSDIEEYLFETKTSNEKISYEIINDEKCKPDVQDAIIEHEGRQLQGQRSVCSDLARKNTKLECQGCIVNK